MPLPARPTISQTPFEIPVRKDLEWDFSATPRHFVDADPFVSFLWAALSADAPPIETFFIKALLPTIESISGDEKLARDVRNMVAQEGQRLGSPALQPASADPGVRHRHGRCSIPEGVRRHDARARPERHPRRRRGR